MLNENGYHYSDSQIGELAALWNCELSQQEPMGLATEIERAQIWAKDMLDSNSNADPLLGIHRLEGLINDDAQRAALFSCNLGSNYGTNLLMGMLSNKFLIGGVLPSYARWLIASIINGLIDEDSEGQFVYQRNELRMSTDFVKPVQYVELRRGELQSFNTDGELLDWIIDLGYPFFEVRLSKSPTAPEGHTVIYIRLANGMYVCLDPYYPEWCGSLLYYNREMDANIEHLAARFGPGAEDYVQIVSTMAGHLDKHSGRAAWLAGVS